MGYALTLLKALCIIYSQKPLATRQTLLRSWERRQDITPTDKILATGIGGFLGGALGGRLSNTPLFSTDENLN